jgi:pentatricopeptide repeat protein
MSKPGGCGVDNITFGILIKGLCEAQRLDEAYELLEAIERGIAPGHPKLLEWLVQTLLNAFVETVQGMCSVLGEFSCTIILYGVKCIHQFSFIIFLSRDMQGLKIPWKL